MWTWLWWKHYLNDKKEKIEKIIIPENDDDAYISLLESISKKDEKDEIYPSAGARHNELSMAELLKKSNTSIKWLTDKFNGYDTPYICDVLNHAIIDRGVSIDIVFADGRPDLNTCEVYKILDTHQKSHKKIRFTDVSEKLKLKINTEDGRLVTFTVIDSKMFQFTRDTKLGHSFFNFNSIKNVETLENIIDKEFIETP